MWLATTPELTLELSTYLNIYFNIAAPHFLRFDCACFYFPLVSALTGRVGSAESGRKRDEVTIGDGASVRPIEGIFVSGSMTSGV